MWLSIWIILIISIIAGIISYIIEDFWFSLMSFGIIFIASFLPLMITYFILMGDSGAKEDVMIEELEVSVIRVDGKELDYPIEGSLSLDSLGIENHTWDKDSNEVSFINKETGKEYKTVIDHVAFAPTDNKEATVKVHHRRLSRIWRILFTSKTFEDSYTLNIPTRR